MNQLLGLLILLVFLLLSACGGERATPSPAAPTEPAVAAPTSATAAGSAAAGMLTGPLVGFYIEDSYEDVYFALYDAGAGAFRVVQSDTPIYIGEAQWFDDGCRLFVHGQVTDLLGAVEWSVPPEVAARIEHINSAALSPARRYIAHVVAGASDGPSDIEIITLAPPYDAVRLGTGGGGPRAMAWSADEQWLYHTEHDANGVLQLFRASPDGATNEQLTHHAGGVAAITGLSPSPGGSHLAYSVQNLFQPGQPYTYRAADEGWIGIIDLRTGASAAVRPAKFGSAEPGRGLIWNETGETLLVIGDSLPVSGDDPDAGRRVLWVSAAGEVTNAIRTADGPESHLGWIAPLGSIDTLLVNVLNDYYLYEGGAFRRLDASQAPPLGMELGRRPIAVLPAPIGFPGEAECD